MFRSLVVALLVGASAVCAHAQSSFVADDSLGIAGRTSAPAPWRTPERARRDTTDRAVSGPGRHFYLHFILGAVTSIAAHETGHIVAAYAVGGHPSFGFDKARPTIFSGIDASREPRKQFIFSSAGLTVQNVLDELILDVPHRRGGAFERGLLAGGIGTTLFYITIGRNGSVSDVDFMSRTSSLSKSQLSLIFGGVAALHAVRIHFDQHYAHFFAAPDADGRLRVGMVVMPSAGEPPRAR